MKAALGKLDALVGGIVAALVAAALVIAALGIANRYAFPGLSLDWAGEVVVIAIIWAILLSLSRVERRSAHIRVDFLFGKFSRRYRVLAVLVALAIGLGIGTLFVWSGWLVVSEAIRWDERTPSTLHLPLWTYYAALPVAFGLNCVFLINRAVEDLRGDNGTKHAPLSD